MHYKVKKRSGQAGWSLKAWEGRERYVPQDMWPAGLKPEMSLEKAREYVKSLNASQRIPADEARRLRAAERHGNRMAIQHALLPEDAVLQFERNHILFMDPADPTRVNREMVWRNAQKLITDLGIHPSDWSLSMDPLYRYMTSKRWSWDYCKRVTSMMNRYGHIYCRLYEKSFFPVQLRDQKKKVEVEMAFGDGEESDPLEVSSLALLHDSKKVPEAKWSWLWICFWFGLRPHEVDMLHLQTWKDGMRTWWVEDDGNTLVVYQPKLTKVRPKRRYKRIPVAYSEQVYALELLRRGDFKRPSDKQARRWLPEEVTLYGCRHGFACLMDKVGVDVFAISRWLGHQSVTTTERYYVRLGIRRDAA